MNTPFFDTGWYEPDSETEWLSALELDEFNIDEDELDSELKRRRLKQGGRLPRRLSSRRPSKARFKRRPRGSRRTRQPGRSLRPRSRQRPRISRPGRRPIRIHPGKRSRVIIRQPPAPCVCPVHKTEFVRWVQSSLNQVLGLRLRINGVMNPVTRNALRDFQQQEGLPVDGIAGPETEKALIEARARTGSGAQYQSGSQASDDELDMELDLFNLEMDEEVQRNSREYIRWVQRSLNRILSLRLAVDGISGPLTRSAVRSFQARQGLVVDGIVGPQTERALIAAGAGNPPGVTLPSYPKPRKTPGKSSRARLAAKILDSTRIELWPNSPTGGNSTDGADAFSNIRDTAQGRAAKCSNYGNAPGGSVYLDTRLLNGILSLSKTYGMRITSIAGGSHSVNSRHYAGIACDVDSINGVRVSSSNPYVAGFMQKCRALGADQVLGPGSEGHDRHIHLAWPRA